MTKEQVIQEAYGEYWENLKESVDENGYANLDNSFSYEDIGLEQQINGNWRPKSLQGIENNNGWIKIESESDLPNEGDLYFVCDNNGFEDVRAFWNSYKKWWIDNYTHYQPIVKPEKPIY